MNDRIKDHKLNISVAPASLNSIEVVIEFFGKDIEITTKTSREINLDSFTLNRTGFSYNFGEEANADIEEELYDSKVSLAIHTGTFDHNLIAIVTSLESTEEMKEAIEKMIAETCEMVANGNYKILETRRTVFNKAA